MNRPIVNLDEVELVSRPSAFAASGEAADRFDAKMGMIGPALGAVQLGYNITCVPAGKCAFPFHNHRVNEEMFLVLSGSGEIRIGAKVYPVKEHDIIACPAGGEETAHQLKNTGADELKFLAVSTKLSPEIANYPDSGKFAVIAEFPPDAAGEAQGFRYVGREDGSIDYWDGE